MQEIAGKVAIEGGAPIEGQIVRGTSLPPFLCSCVEMGEAVDRPWFHVILDNFCAGQSFGVDSHMHCISALCSWPFFPLNIKCLF